MNVLENLAKARKLPPGHYDIKKAELLVEKEYHRSQQNEMKFSQRLRSHLLDVSAVWDLCNSVTSALMLPKIKKIVLESPRVRAGAGACYWNGEIHFPHSFIHCTSFLHELAHHVQRCGGFGGPTHGDGFLEAENLVFEVVRDCRKRWFK